jgi:orotate phosphoribosyltransferase
MPDGIEQYAIDFLKDNVRTNAFRTGQFKLKSGRPSKYFYNLGDAMNDGQGVLAARDAYVTLMVERMQLLQKHDPDQIFIFGPAYKGIPLGGVIAGGIMEQHGANVRWGYDRKEKKEHGADANEWLVGNLKDGDIVVIADDVMTTSQTKRDAWDGLRVARQGLSHGGIMIALDRQETDTDGGNPIQILANEGIVTGSILRAREVFEYLHNMDIDGTVIVDDTVYGDFQDHQKQFGIEE